MTPPSRLAAARSAAILGVGALALHQLGYLLTNGGHAAQVLASSGHGYLTSVAPAIAVVALAIGATALARAWLAPRAWRPPAHEPCFELRAAAFALALLGIFSAQELLEGALFAGHPDGLSALVAGGWIVLPLAFPIGALAALALGGLERAERRLAAASSARALRPIPRSEPRPAALGEPLAALAGLTLGFGFARRPPPSPANP